MTTLYEQQMAAEGADPVFTAANTIHAEADQAYERIRADSRISDLVKTQQIARAYVTSRDKLAGLQAQIQSDRANRISQLKRTAFGVPADPIAAMSYRDAQRTAAGVEDPSVAQYQIKRALEHGDDLLAQALAHRSVELGWQHALAEFTTARPEVGAALDELNALSNPDVQRTMMLGFHLTPVKPAEFSRVDDWKIDTIAEPQAS